MATNTILQSLNDSTEAAGITSSNRRQSETFIASAATLGTGLLRVQ